MSTSDLSTTLSETLGMAVNTEAVLLSCDGAVVTFLFEENQRTPVAVAKISAAPVLNDCLQLEYANQRRAEKVRLETPHALAPKTLGNGEWMKHYYFLQEYVDGTMLSAITELDAAWWQDTRKRLKITEVCDLLLKFQSGSYRRAVPLKALELTEELRAYRAAFTPRGAEEVVVSAIEERLLRRQHDRVPLVACHGDFSTNNVLQTRDGLRILDWRYYSEAFHPIFDVTTMCLSFLGRFEGNEWTPIWDGKKCHHDLVVFLQTLMERVSHHWGIDRDLLHALVQSSCVSLAIRGYKDSGTVRSRDEGWRKVLLWIGNEHGL